jgi:mRNA interferase RelE/StbE
VSDAYDLVLTPPARRSLATGLPEPEPVAAAVVEFLTSTLIGNPHRLGEPLGAELAGIWSARRGTYRVLYRINEAAREVVVLRVEHRRDAYR